MEGLFHILERKYAQKNAHFWEQKILFFTEICTNQEGQNMHQIFLGASDHETVSSLFEDW